MNRRGLLKLLGAAPIAAPVVAREAATKAGLAPLGMMAEGPYGCSPSQASISETAWVTEWCQRVFTKAWAEEKRREGKMGYPQRLDPDLASSRSLSLSAAMHIQREREIARRIERERADAKRRFLELTGLPYVVLED